MAKRKILIAGALGLTGRAAVRHFEQKGWEVVGLSRRTPDQAYRDLGGKQTTYIAVDLRDPADCEAKLSGLKDVTHIVYAAVYETSDLKAGWVGGAEDFVGINVKMLGNFLDVIGPSFEEAICVFGLRGQKCGHVAEQLTGYEFDGLLLRGG